MEAQTEQGADVGGGIRRQGRFTDGASPSNLDFQPVPVNGKKLNQGLIMDI